MDTDALEGTRLPEGETTIERQAAFLWADATGNDHDEFRYDEAAGEGGQLVPPSMCQHVAFEASGGIEETIGTVAEDWDQGAALGQLRAEFHAGLRVGETYRVAGHVENVQVKEGSTSDLTIVTFAYEVVDGDGDPAYDMEADIVLFDT